MPVCIKRRRKINPSRAEFLFKAANDVSKIVKRVRPFDFPIRAHFCKYVLLEHRVLHDFVFFHARDESDASRGSYVGLGQSRGNLYYDAIYHPLLSVTSPSPRASLLACVRSSFVDPSLPRLLAPLPRQPPRGSLFFGDVREVHGALVNVFMGLWDN